ncbi:type II secretion system F family protein [Paraburkholderia sp. MMS20-SJTR3]|uniref:Type II secretion system F family protein n=1 Tax=Paraburkholderia sejongensis TaxID=2886946 RepID=A0ABS8JSG6_9BURK|nr:type II secretion system F family protein [Paraburkholderia sp. MMS20-SJTR3]MCC8392694.1 type II secretion system F family protein [Paraburkholderia sp. MMS20-SJTR3]
MQTLNLTQILLLLGVFAIVSVAAFGALHLATPRDMSRRIEQAGGPNLAPALEQAGGTADTPWYEKLVEISQPISRLSVPKEGWEQSALRVQLMNAGWRSANAAPVYLATKTALAVVLPLLALVALYGTALATTLLERSIVLMALAALGYYLPNVVLSRRIAARQRSVVEDFPDALDLLTVCVEAGLSLDAALLKVGEEIRMRSAVVASELELMLLEMRSGFSKEKALRNFSLRTGVEDIDSFSSMLIQAERFGTGIGASLRVLSDTLRTRRRMRAEERAAKISLKLLFPLVFCIFPALLVVLMGPAMIHIYRELLPSMAGGA